MTEQLKYRAKLKARGLDTTGVTEAHARQMAATLGNHTLVIGEVVHDTLVTDAEGNQQVTLKLLQVEPVPEHMEDGVRDLMRSLYRQRPDVLGQAALAGTEAGPTPEDALKVLDTTFVERDDEGAPTGVWDGDQDAADAPEPAAEAVSNVAQFSGKAKA